MRSKGFKYRTGNLIDSYINGIRIILTLTTSNKYGYRLTLLEEGDCVGRPLFKSKPYLRYNDILEMLSIFDSVELITGTDNKPFQIILVDRFDGCSRAETAFPNQYWSVVDIDKDTSILHNAYSVNTINSTIPELFRKKCKRIQK